ncbi:MAG: hypothetical protein ACI9LX_003926 [Paraglaciecola sp.]|jgi:hypothetical protein
MKRIKVFIRISCWKHVISKDSFHIGRGYDLAKIISGVKFKKEIEGL